MDESGDSVPPAFLTHIYGSPVDTELMLSLLQAYAIPHICEYPSNGLLDKLIMGQATSGIKVFVPETMLEDAQNLLSAEAQGDVPDGELDCDDENGCD